MPLSNSHIQTGLPAMPTISFQHPGTGQRITMPISDHTLMVKNTRYGAVATLNILNPGSPVVPGVGSAMMGRPLSSGEMIRLPPQIEKERMDKMAQYIVQSFNDGVGLLTLQEIPKPNSPEFMQLRDSIAFYAQQAGVSINIADLTACWKPTRASSGHVNFGTSVLCNPNIFTLKAKQTVNDPMVTAGRAAVYEITALDGTKISVANIHGLGGAANTATEHYIQQFDGICLGDANTYSTSTSPAVAEGTQAVLNIVAGGIAKTITVNTLDVIKVNPSLSMGYTPATNKIMPPSVTPIPIVTSTPIISPPAAIQVRASQAKQLLDDFSAYLKSTPSVATKIKAPIHTDGRINGIKLRSPGGSGSPSTITFEKQGLSEAYQLFDKARLAIKIPPIELLAFKPVAIQVPASQAKLLLDNFSTYLNRNPGVAAKIPSPLFGRNDFIEGIRLTTPPHSSSATITFNKPGLSEAYRQFDAARQAMRTSPIEQPAFKAIRVQVPGNQALQLLNDFKTYVAKHPSVALKIPDHLHLLEGSGFIKGVSLSMPSNNSSGTIIFEKPGLAEAYQEFSASRHRPFTPVAMMVPKEQGKKLVNDFRDYLHNTSSLKNTDAWINGVTLFTPSDDGLSTITFNKPGIFEAYQEFNASRHRPFTPVAMMVPKEQGKKLVNDFRDYLHNTSSLKNTDAWINGVTLFTPSDDGLSTITFNKPGIFEAYQEFNASRLVVISDPSTLSPLITQDVTSGEMFKDIIKKFKHSLSEIRENEPKPEEQEYSTPSNYFSFGSH